MLTLDKIYHAAYVLKDVARTTDLIPAPNLNPDCNVFLKTENLQVTGSFKLRGAYYRISQLSDEEKAKGVIACSAGNHAQGVALAATKNNINAVICIPASAPISKVENTRRYGAEVCLVDGVYDDAAAKAQQIQEESGRTFIHPFNDPDVIAGQGTIGLEILNQCTNPEVVLVPVGGGGLISGVAFAIKSLHPECKVYGVQAAGAASMQNALKKQKVEALPSVATFADGIAVKCPGDLTYECVTKYVDGVVTVTEEETAAAVLALMEKHKLVSEGAGAVSVAAAMFNKVDLKGKNVVCVVSGGNIDVTILSKVINRGLVQAGRYTELTIEMADRPGGLKEITTIIANLGANVVSVLHDRSSENIGINNCFLQISMETRDREHVKQIRDEVTKAGYRLIDRQAL